MLNECKHSSSDVTVTIVIFDRASDGRVEFCLFYTKPFRLFEISNYDKSGPSVVREVK